MKKDDQLTTLIAMLKRLHRQQQKISQKSTKPDPTNPASLKIGHKKAKTQQHQHNYTNNQSQEINTVFKKPISILMLSSRNRAQGQEEKRGWNLGAGGRGLRDFNYSEVGARSLKFRNQAIKKKMKSQIIQVSDLSQSNNSGTANNSPSNRLNKVLFSIEPHPFSLNPSPFTTKKTRPPPPYFQKQPTRINNYNKYCNQIHQKYTNRVRVGQQQQQRQGQECYGCEEHCSNKYSCAVSRSFAKCGKIGRGKSGDHEEARWIKIVKNLDLKAVSKDNTNGEEEEKDEGGVQQVQLASKMQQHLANLQSVPSGEQNAPLPVKSTHKTMPIDNPIQSRSRQKQKQKIRLNIITKNPKQKQEQAQNPTQIVQQYEDSQIKIEGWHANSNSNSNNRITYGNVKNVVSRSASIHGVDFI